MITKTSRVTMMLIVLLVAASYQDVKAQGVPAKSEPKPAAGSLKGLDQQLAIPQSASGCTTKHGPREPCGRWVCLTGDNSWEDVPLKAGTRCNTNGHCNGIDPDVCLTSVTGTIYPSYYIASVIYVPPGSGSSVDYGTGSTVGTTTSTTDSWKNSVQVEVSNGADFLGLAAGQVTFGFGNDWGGSSTTSVDIQATVSSDMKVPAPQSDLINHNYDQIVLLLGPEIDVSIIQGDGPDQVNWALNLSRAIPQVVLVGWLNGAMTMPSDVAGTLSQFGITTQDYTQMLNADPFASDSTGKGKPDPARFTKSTVLPYEPIAGQYTYKTNNSYTSSTTQTTTVNYTVGATVKGTVVGQSLKVSDNFTWGNSSSQKATSGNSDTETVVVSMPSSAYTGPTDLYVYVDTVYKTFFFSFLSPSGSTTSHYAKRRKR